MAALTKEGEAIKHKVSVRKLALTAMLSCLGLVLSTVVHFPQMAPFQHFVNVLAAVFVGPFYGFAGGLLTGLLRMLLNGRDIQAVVGAVIGAFLSGVLYRATGRIWGAFVGEVVGTGLLSGLAVYPLMKLLYHLDVQSPFFYVLFYTPSSFMGAFMGCALLGILQRSGALARMRAQLE